MVLWVHLNVPRAASSWECTVRTWKFQWWPCNNILLSAPFSDICCVVQSNSCVSVFQGIRQVQGIFSRTSQRCHHCAEVQSLYRASSLMKHSMGWYLSAHTSYLDGVVGGPYTSALLWAWLQNSAWSCSMLVSGFSPCFWPAPQPSSHFFGPDSSVICHVPFYYSPENI